MTLNAWFPSHPLFHSLVLNSDQKLFSIRQTSFNFTVDFFFVLPVAALFFFSQRVFPLQLAVLIIRFLLKLLWASSVYPAQPYYHIKSLRRSLLINNAKIKLCTGLISEIKHLNPLMSVKYKTFSVSGKNLVDIFTQIHVY